MKIFAFLLVAMLAAAAGPVSVSGPLSAVVFDGRSQSIRVITGAPGAALLGASLVDHVQLAEVSPDGNSAIVIGKPNGAEPATSVRRTPPRENSWPYAIVGLTSGNPAWVPLRMEQRGLSRIAWNSTSTAAAVYSAASRTLSLVTGISAQDITKGNAATITTLRMDALTGDVTSLAVDAAGDAVIVAIAGAGAGIYLLTPQNLPALLAPVGNPSAMFLFQDENLLIADAASLQLWELQNFRGVAQLTPFAPLPDGASQPAGVAMSSDQRFAFVADQACGCLVTYQFPGATLVSQAPLPAAPEFLKPVSMGRQFVLNSPVSSNNPFWILNPLAPSVYFVSNSN